MLIGLDVVTYIDLCFIEQNRPLSVDGQLRDSLIWIRDMTQENQIVKRWYAFGSRKRGLPLSVAGTCFQIAWFSAFWMVEPDMYPQQS
jgi:hypothetical protein